MNYELRSMQRRKKILVWFSVILIIILLIIGSGVWGVKLEKWKLPALKLPTVTSDNIQIKVVSEESVVVNVVKKVTPAVVTVGITKNQPVIDWNFDPWGFGGFSPRQQGSKEVKQDIGSGFVVKSDGLIVTNKHVVADTNAKYRVITADNKTFDAVKIYRDPSNDLAILKINTSGLATVELGDSDKLQVGQMAIAIGTALGEFRSTVTTGVVSGIGRSITAGSFYQGSEKLDNIIQTSAAINPGNSGGPLLNSSGQVIGVNVAVAADGQNIGFALPINLLKTAMGEFEGNGGFDRKKAYLGVEYRMITRQLSVLNEVPEGAYVQSVVSGSPAEKAGVQEEDIITKIDGKNVRDADGGLAKIISSYKPGQVVELTVYRGEDTKTVKATLTEASQ
jgi:S1-C subfamily serine protease